MKSWKQVRTPLLAAIFAAVVLVLVRVVLLTAFSHKQKDNTYLPNLPIQIAALMEEK
ncbi:MAG: hypothetical protein KI793_25595 [Rivularia sp. (in: Bacteria)]|nr:hypothetical protein [Rivularia sp. MS3]